MPKNQKLLLAALVFFAANILAGAGVCVGAWDLRGALYFYWAECVLIGGLSVAFYAKHLVVFFVLLFAVGWVIGLKEISMMQDAKAPIAFWGVYSLFWLFYFELRKSRLGQRIRLLHPLNQFAFYLSFMIFATLASFTLTDGVLFNRLTLPALPTKLLEELLTMVIAVPTLTIVILRIIDMIGARHFLDFLFGIYHQPVERKQIIAFLDMVGSSALAEKLPPKQSMEIIARFIFDACLVFRLHGGDVVNFTGDGLVILWPINQGDRALAAVKALQDRLKAHRAEYEEKFEIVPSFRMGLHAGDVVLSQIGEEKLFLGLHGDAVNTAARLEQLCKNYQTRLIFSRAFRHRLSEESQDKIVSLGRVEISGREETMEIFTVK